MAREVQVVSELPADVETTVALLASERYVAQRAEALRVAMSLVSREELPGGGLRLTLSRALPDGVPSLLERFLPADGRLTEVRELGPPDAAGARSGVWSVSGRGVPAEMGGELRVDPALGGSRETVRGTVRVKVPLVGGKIEGMLADLVEQLLRKEAEVARGLLA